MSQFTNESGVHPTGDKVLVLPDEVDEKTEGGIILAPSTTDRESMAAFQGTLVEYGDAAWSGYVKDGETVKRWAEPGDRVLFAKYGGIMFHGRDGKKYRLINDADISARLEGDTDVSRKPNE